MSNPFQIALATASKALESYHDVCNPKLTGRPDLQRRLQGLRAKLDSLAAESDWLIGAIDRYFCDDEVKVNLPVQNSGNGSKGSATQLSWPLAPEEYQRYGRQLIMPEIGLRGQLCLKNSSVLVIGAGGLGCPAAAYLAGAGVGRIGVVDGDVVEESNLHRQVMHRTETIGVCKAVSLIQSLEAINNLPEYVPHTTHLSAENAAQIASGYDVILDCTDRPSSRYLVSDTAVLCGKPLVSASALRTDGQLMVLNNPPAPPGSDTGGPCYRCIFPKPPPPESVLGCSEGGILGPVVGTMGLLQALETIKLIVKGTGAGAAGEKRVPARPSLLMFAAMSEPQFRAVRLRGRRRDCRACSAEATITAESLASGSQDYVQFCGLAASSHVLRPEERISAADFAKQRENAVVIDVRERVQFELCSLPGSVNIPFSEVQRWRAAEDVVPSLAGAEVLPDLPINVVCRLGNDSQVTVHKMKQIGAFGQGRQIQDVEGGFEAWRRDVDHSWPEY